MLDAVAAIDRDGPALAAQAVFPDGRTRTLAAAPGVVFFGPLTSGHFDTYFLLPETIDKLNRTAAAFAASSAPPDVGSGTFDSLRVNAGSLIFGGLYAVCDRPDTRYDVIVCGGHRSHRIGTDVDLD